MSEKIGSILEDQPLNQHRGVVHAFNYAVGAMIAHNSAAGANPYAGIDIEQLFSAVQMLGGKDALEVAPFVQWSPALAAIGRQTRIPANFDRRFKESMLGKNSFMSNAPGKLIESLVLAVTGATDSERTFKELERQMLMALVQLVAVDPAMVSYLTPLLTLNGGAPIDIVTLNYDQSVEFAADAAKLTYDTGIDNWAGGQDWQWSRDARVRLLKLHGSIDWHLTERRGAGGLPEPYVTAHPELLDGSEYYDEPSPGVVFGARGKVRARGPFLAMLRAFDDRLKSADNVLIVGYSFRDDHVNVALSRWLNSAAPRELYVIDPAFPTQQSWLDRDSYQGLLLAAAQQGRYEGESAEPRVHLHVSREFAAIALAKIQQVGLNGIPAVSL